MKKKPIYRNITVFSIERLTPHLQRIVFTGEDLKSFPVGEEGAYVKVILEEDKKVVEEMKERPRMRSYTVGHFDSNKSLLTLDFVVGEHSGHSTDWAKNAKVGEQIVIVGPGPRKIYDFPVTDYLLFGDLTSVNAVRAYLNLVPKEATGKAIVFVPSQEDFLELETQSSIDIEFVVLDCEKSYKMYAASFETLSEKTIVFAAGETSQINELRKFLIDERSLPTDKIYISSYWKRGKTDEEFRLEKRRAKA